MFRFIKRIGCLTIIGFIVFVSLSLWKGGDAFRWLGEKAGGVVERVVEKLADKADEIKGKAEGTRKKVKKWSEKDLPNDEK